MSAPLNICDIKFCSGCEQHKPRDEFSRNKRNADGLQGWCDGCMLEYRHTRKVRRSNYHNHSKRSKYSGHEFVRQGSRMLRKLSEYEIAEFFDWVSRCRAGCLRGKQWRLPRAGNESAFGASVAAITRFVSTR